MAVSVGAVWFSSTGLSDGPSRSWSRPCRAWMGPVLPGATSDCALPAESGSVGGTGADPTPACTAGAALSHIILCLDCIWTTTSCDRGKDFCPDRQHLLARSRGCRRSWNTSRQDRPERTYEAQITPARRVGSRSGAQPSPLRVITLRTTHLPQHHCRRPPAIPRRRGITRAVEDPPREVHVQIGDKGAQPLFAEPREPRNHAVSSSTLSARCRLCHRFGHSPPFQGPLHVRGTAWEVAFAGVTTATLTQIRTGRPMSPRRPALLADRHSFVGLTRHRATRWPDRVGDHAPTTWLHEH